MKAFVIEPHDPLVFGNGKPFSAVPGARNDSLPLPPPSTLAGLVRTTAGRDADGVFDTGRIEELLNRQIAGPHLVVLDGEPELALPAPADMLRLAQPAPLHKAGEDSVVHLLKRLVPLSLGEGDLVSDPELAPVGQVVPNPSKPPRSAPGFWRASALLRWLTHPPDPRLSTEVSPGFGVEVPRPEERTHIAIDPGTGVAGSGALFGTVGRRFNGWVDGVEAALGLYGETNAALSLPSHVVLGGEGRLSLMTPSARLLPAAPPEEVLAAARQGFVRVYLLTPAPLGGSRWSPDWASVVAQASGRPDIISGWAYAPPKTAANGYPAAANRKRRGGTPKPTRRLVPAGSVFFLKLHAQGDEAAERVRNLWGQSIVDGQDARDGFGRILFGAWDGAFHKLIL